MGAGTLELLRIASILLTLSFLAHSCEKEDLIMVQMIVRHGDTSPRATYPQDLNPVELWKEGLNDLTMLGKFQSFALGYSLRVMYDYFITSDPTELEVMSSSSRACFKSAQAFVTSLYAPSPNWEIVQDFSYQPIYIHSGPTIDKYLGPADCPAVSQEYERTLKEEIQSLPAIIEDFIVYWQEQSGKQLESFADIDDLYNCLRTEALYNLTIPRWAHSTMEQLEYMHDIAFSAKFKSQRLKRLIGGNILNVVLNAMEKKASGELNQTKVMIYSTHDTQFASFLSLMDIWNNKHPGPGNTILVELYRQDDIHLVRYLFLNTTSPERLPHQIYPLIIPGCTEYCPLEYLLELAKKMAPENWEEECQTLQQQFSSEEDQ